MAALSSERMSVWRAVARVKVEVELRRGRNQRLTGLRCLLTGWR